MAEETAGSAKRWGASQMNESAKKGDVVLVTGKGTDPYIMGPQGSKLPWDDASVAREELKKLKTSMR